MTTYYFSLLLVFGSLFTGIVWAIDHWVWKPKRMEKIRAAEAQAGVKLSAEQAEQLAPQSGLADFAQAAFPVLFVILILRSFLYEPFRIPSGSMMPTLLVGDFILVEKFRYGLREPITRKEFINTGRPERGDIAVFKYPVEPDLDYIKRVIGMPGDRITYTDKTFYVQPNCLPDCSDVEPIVLQREFQAEGEFMQQQVPVRRYIEQGINKEYDVLVNPRVNIHSDSFVWDVPEGQYFFIGDNRDNSIDSRYWGFVDEDLLVGRAVFIWLSFEFERDANSWLPTWVPSKLRFDRLGRIE
ncbi:signal peptidase I [Aliidiomarina iranensis]|uniref:Signal peptidase I n=1 Tax=Aliidiomarina iranensis TaxID=1434071 RepID=A0A432W0H4_9GAMM|nr:signal peptidase I [Aliidiomarina iranensis]RUO22515.1 signal peptidase I [Aliidiomarina iranensis]